MIAVTGFLMGGGLGESFAQEKYTTDKGYVTVENTNELTSFFSSDGI